jgi:hypothetical protein
VFLFSYFFFFPFSFFIGHLDIQTQQNTRNGL